MNIDLEKLRKETQAKCDNASGDMRYVAALAVHHAASDCSAILDPDDDEATQTRIGMVSHAIAMMVAMHRANGGIGEGKVWFTLKDNHLTGHYRFITNNEQLIEFLREIDGFAPNA